MNANLARNLSPRSLVSAAAASTLQEFLLIYGDTQFLLVRVDDAQGELALGLDVADRTGGSNPANLNVLGYHTVADTGPGRRRPGRPEPAFVAADLMRLVANTPYFAVSLRKRVSEATYMERISIGRARNKDIVLRHRSVSKFHAWFELDTSGCLCIADAGSKNGTRHNDRVLAPRTLQPVHPGDVVCIGSVEGVLCPPETLWSAANR